MVEIDVGTLLAPVEGRPGVAGYVPPPLALDVRRAYVRFGVYAHVLDVYGTTRWRMRVGRADTDAFGRIGVLFDPRTRASCRPTCASSSRWRRSGSRWRRPPEAASRRARRKRSFGTATLRRVVAPDPVPLSVGLAAFAVPARASVGRRPT